MITTIKCTLTTQVSRMFCTSHARDRAEDDEQIKRLSLLIQTEDCLQIVNYNWQRQHNACKRYVIHVWKENSFMVSTTKSRGIVVWYKNAFRLDMACGDKTRNSSKAGKHIRRCHMLRRQSQFVSCQKYSITIGKPQFAWLYCLPTVWSF